METKLKNDTKNLIAQVKVLNEKYDAIRKINGENFNIFSILNLETDEVKTHSYFIYNLINPNGSHDQGDIFLKFFLEHILSNGEYKDMGEIRQVKREDPTNENRRIDFTIETSKFLIGIEMKIDARDQDSQLEDYYTELKRRAQNQEPKLFYLTLYGTKATEESAGKLSDEEYHTLSFYYDIYPWIEQCIEKSATIPTLREGLVQYRNLIRKLTNQTSDEIGEDMENILNTPKDIEAANTIVQEYSKILAKKEADFWFDLYEKIEEELGEDNKFEVIYITEGDIDDDEKIDFNFISDQRNKKDAYFGLSIYKNYDSYKIVCDIYKSNTGNNIEMDFRILKKKEVKLNKIDTIIREIGFNRRRRETTRFLSFKETIKFYGDGEPTYKLFDDKCFNELVEKTKEEAIKYLDAIAEKEKEIVETLENKL